VFLWVVIPKRGELSTQKGDLSTDKRAIIKIPLREKNPPLAGFYDIFVIIPVI